MRVTTVFSTLAAQAGMPFFFAAAQDDAAPFINLIKNATAILASVGGTLAIAYLVYGGILYITSGEDVQHHDNAKRVLKHAVLGLLIVGGATAIGTVASAISANAFGK
ncbi:MAG TPA: hypothetical protein VJP80_02455 [Candidatus Saccharimonadales bacterium]|nr:hypothetical protein [Candidatus Saccharimonadales bacterium]